MPYIVARIYESESETKMYQVSEIKAWPVDGKEHEKKDFLAVQLYSAKDRFVCAGFWFMLYWLTGALWR